jgi:hypothetical protein
MEYLLYECTHYSQLVWTRLGEIMTLYLNSLSPEYVTKVEITQLNVIYNVPHPSLLLYVHDKLTCNGFLIPTQEIKRDITFHRMNLPPSARQVATSQRLMAHLDSTLRRLQSYFEYILVGCKNSTWPS